MINEENFYLATRERKPYVVDSGGVKSFYAVCPECDNPIQLIGLLRRQQDSLPHRPYGRHIGHDVPGVAVYDEDAYLSCPFSDPGYWRTDRKRKPSNPTGQALYRIMRDRFDRVEYAWRESSGLLLGIKSLRRALTVWRNDKGWLNYGSTYCSECASTAALSIDCYRPLSACVHVECPTGTDRLPSYPQKPSDVPRHASHGGRAHPSGMGYTLSPFSHGRPVPPDLSRPSFLIFFSRGTVRRRGLFLYHDRVRSFLWTGMTMMNTRNRMEWTRNGIPFPRHGLWMTARVGMMAVRMPAACPACRRV